MRLFSHLLLTILHISSLMWFLSPVLLISLQQLCGDTFFLFSFLYDFICRPPFTRTYHLHFGIINLSHTKEKKETNEQCHTSLIYNRFKLHHFIMPSHLFAIMPIVRFVFCLLGTYYKWVGLYHSHDLLRVQYGCICHPSLYLFGTSLFLYKYYRINAIFLGLRYLRLTKS